MARVKVPPGHESIGVFDGEKQATYKVDHGVINVDDAHLAAVLASVPGSSVAPEAPAAKEK